MNITNRNFELYMNESGLNFIIKKHKVPNLTESLQLKLSSDTKS